MASAATSRRSALFAHLQALHAGSPGHGQGPASPALPEGMEAPGTASSRLDWEWEGFRRECSLGIPERARPVCWKLLLDLLPWDAVQSGGGDAAPAPMPGKEVATTPPQTTWDRVQWERRSLYYSWLADIRAPTLEEHDAIHLHHLCCLPSGAPLPEKVEMLEQIERDVLRTAPDFAFFQQPVPHPPFPLPGEVGPDTQQSDKQQPPPPTHPALRTGYPDYASVWPKAPRTLFQYIPRSPDHEGELRQHGEYARPPMPQSPEQWIGDSEDTAPPIVEEHWEVMERILYVFGKLNPGIGYVQGMNEILTPLYYVFANDTDVLERAHAEADAFFAFTAIMSVIRDLFIKTLDNLKGGTKRASTLRPGPVDRSTTSLSFQYDPPSDAPHLINSAQAPPTETGALYANGIGDSMERLLRRLLARDRDVWKTFGIQQIHPAFFAFRWFTTLFTREFRFPDVLRIWDSLLADLAIDLMTKAADPVVHVLQQGEGSPHPAAQQPQSPHAHAHASSALQPPAREGKFDFVIEFGTAMLM